MHSRQFFIAFSSGLSFSLHRTRVTRCVRHSFSRNKKRRKVNVAPNLPHAYIKKCFFFCFLTFSRAVRKPSISSMSACLDSSEVVSSIPIVSAVLTRLLTRWAFSAFCNDIRSIIKSRRKGHCGNGNDFIEITDDR